MVVKTLFYSIEVDGLKSVTMQFSGFVATCIQTVIKQLPCSCHNFSENQNNVTKSNKSKSLDLNILFASVSFESKLISRSYCNQILYDLQNTLKNMFDEKQLLL